jgi:hypothetical protein
MRVLLQRRIAADVELVFAIAIYRDFGIVTDEHAGGCFDGSLFCL